MSEYQISVEKHPTLKPIPLGFCVFADGRRVASLTLEQVKKVVAEYEGYEAALRPSSARASDVGR